MPEITAYMKPKDINEALLLLREFGDRAKPLAGGTTLILSPLSKVDALVDLSELGLDHIEEQQDGLHIGAMVTISKLRSFLGGLPRSALWDATTVLGTRVLQNHITVGGNCIMTYKWSDMPVVFLCLNAVFRIEGETPRVLNADKFFSEHPTRIIKKGELLTEIIVPKFPTLSSSGFIKFSKTKGDHAIASACAFVRFSGNGNIEETRISVGGVSGLPQLIIFSEGLPLSKDAFSELGEKVSNNVEIFGDFRGSAEYRKFLLKTLVADAIELACSRIRGES